MSGGYEIEGGATTITVSSSHPYSTNSNSGKWTGWRVVITNFGTSNLSTTLNV